MKKIIFFLALTLLFNHNIFAKKGENKSPEDSAANELMYLIKLRDSVTKAMKYETGTVLIEGGFAKLNIPKGFKFLNATQSKYVLTELWGNPERSDILGMIFPDSTDPFTDKSFVFVISFDEMGYVKDDDAKDMNYDDLLKEMNNDEAETNKQRKAAGYGSIHMVGWAQKPFYDNNRKVLHWAKNLKFEDNEENTLNYDVRVLGRKGVLSLNAIASMNELALVQSNIDKVLNMAEFTDGNKYEDFNSSTDQVAAWTIGGLVAGKVLAKVGFWALLLKFWKLIIAGIVAAWFGLNKFIFKKKEDETYTSPETTEEPNTIVIEESSTTDETKKEEVKKS